MAKLFLGGIAPTTQKEDIEQHFSIYGTIIDAVVMYKDGKPRGFGFVTFSEPEAIDAVLAEPQIIHERTIDVKPAVPSDERPPPRANGAGGCGYGAPPPAYGGGSFGGGGCGGGGGYGGYCGAPRAAAPRPSAPALPPGGGGGGGGPVTDKVFIGGLASTTTDDTLNTYFGRYGTLVDVVVMKDKITQKPRGFGFVRYDSPDPVEAVMADYQTHQIDGKWIEVKRAVPQERGAPASYGAPPGRGPPPIGKGGYGGGCYGGGYGCKGGYGAPPGPMGYGAPGPYGGGYAKGGNPYGGYGACHGGAYVGGGYGAARQRPY